MASFEAMCEGFPGIGEHWYLFQYFFRFTCLRDGTRVATIGCANRWMKQGRSDDYISVTLTSSNSSWHKGWFYLQNDPDHALLAPEHRAGDVAVQGGSGGSCCRGGIDLATATSPCHRR
jgi:hypothetical protein